MIEKNEKILELKIRKKVFIFIEKYPGTHLREIERITKIPYSTLKYHLNYLNKHDLITEKQEKGNNKYYSKTIKSEDIELIGLLKQKNIRKILIYLVSYKEVCYKDLESFTNLAPSTIIWYMKKLISKNIIEKINKENFEKPIYTKFSKKNFVEISSRTKVLDTFKIKDFEVFGNRNHAKFSKGKKSLYKIKSDKEKITKILITYRESFFDSLLDKVIETWDIN